MWRQRDTGRAKAESQRAPKGAGDRRRPGRGQEEALVSPGAQPCRRADLRLQASQTAGQQVSVVLRHSVWGTSSWQPPETTWETPTSVFGKSLFIKVSSITYFEYKTRFLLGP